MFSRHARAVAAAAALSACAASMAHAIDTYSGDWTPLPPGQDIGLIYFTYNQSDTLKFDGDEIKNSSLDLLAVTGRYVHYTELGGLPAGVQAYIPIIDFFNPKVAGADQPTAEGWGDITFAGGLWAIADAPDDPFGTILGASVFLTLPTGNYEFGSISAGTGTSSLALQIGYQQGLGSGFFLDVYGDVTGYKDHTEQGHDISTDPAYQFQSYLRYQSSPLTAWSVGYSALRGGKVYVDDTYVGSKTDKDTVRLGINTFVTDRVQVAFRIDQDLEADDGFKSGPNLNLRLMKMF